MSMLREAQEHLEAERTEHCTEPVDYIRGEVTLVADLPATIGQSEAEGYNAQGAMILATSVDFIVKVTDLGLEPERGDLIRYNGRLYETMPLGETKVWRHTDQFRISIRIHTKDVGEAT